MQYLSNYRMDLQRRQTTWLGGPTPPTRKGSTLVTTTSEAKKEMKRSSPLGPFAGPSAWATPTSSAALRRLGGLQNNIKVNAEGPWRHYNKVLGIRVGGPAILAERKDSGEAPFAIRCHLDQTLGAEAKLFMLQNVQHEHLQVSLEIFLSGTELHVVSPYTEISVLEIIHAPQDPSEGQIACVAGQVK